MLASSGPPAHQPAAQIVVDIAVVLANSDTCGLLAAQSPTNSSSATILPSHHACAKVANAPITVTHRQSRMIASIAMVAAFPEPNRAEHVLERRLPARFIPSEAAKMKRLLLGLLVTVRHRGRAKNRAKCRAMKCCLVESNSLAPSQRAVLLHQQRRTKSNRCIVLSTLRLFRALWQLMSLFSSSSSSSSCPH